MQATGTTRTVTEAASAILATLAKYPQVKGLRKALITSVCGVSGLSARKVQHEMKREATQ